MIHSEHWEWKDKLGPRGNVREAVALFDTEEDMQAAVYDLETHGFSNAAISRPAGPEIVEASVSHPIKHVQELEDNSKIPRESFMDASSKTEGFIVIILVPIYIALLVAAALAVAHGLAVWQGVVISLMMGLIGALIGGYFAYRLTKKRTERARREKEWGGLLVWVRTGSHDQERKAVRILRQHAGRDVHLHGPAHDATP